FSYLQRWKTQACRTVHELYIRKHTCKGAPRSDDAEYNKINNLEHNNLDFLQARQRTFLLTA
uniref:Uncharacterized protein n=1 Tax=Romanomermis culicivorax TaxID=13658 RepID=A0A915L186_ROMCU